MIIREVRNILTNPGNLSESDFVKKLISDKDVDSIMKTIDNINGLDSIILDAIKGKEQEISSAIENLKDDQRALLLKVIGKIRGSVLASTFSSLLKSTGLESEF